MASILIVILGVAAIVVMTIIASKSHHEKKGDVCQYIAKVSNEIGENGSSFLSYKDDFVELAEIVPITGQRAEGPMDTFTTFIAGIERYCDKSDIGYIIGRVMPEPNNEYNPKAMVVKDLDGKKLGYIAESQLEDYRAWSNGVVLPFVGYIVADLSRGFLQLNARIHIMFPISREFLLQRAGRFYGHKEELKLTPKIKDMVIEVPKKFSDDYKEWNKNYGYRKEHNCEAPMNEPNGVYTYRYETHMVKLFGYPIYRHLKANKTNTYKVSDLVKINDTTTPYLSSNDEWKVTETLNNMIYLSIIKVEWLDENTFKYEICKDIPENPDWEKRRKWKQTLPK